MGRPEQNKFIANSQIVTSSNEVGTTAPSPFQLTNPFLVGDYVYHDMNFRVSGNIDPDTAGGTVVTDGGLQFIRAAYFSTPQHAMIFEGIDGIMWHDILTVKNRFHPVHSDAVNASTDATFEYALRLPFCDYESFNYADLGIDVLRSGQPLLQLNLGVVGDFIATAGANDVVGAYTLETHARIDAGPVTDPDLPTQFMPYYGVLKWPISATAAQYDITLAFGDRIIKRLYITQRNSSSLARLSNTIIGAADTDRVSLKINSNFSWFDRVEWLALQDMNAYDYKLASMPTGTGVFDFVKYILGGADRSNPNGGGAGAKLSDALSVLSTNQGTLIASCDVTSVTNGQLWFGYEAVKVLPLGARRPAPQPAVSAKG